MDSIQKQLEERRRRMESGASSRRNDVEPMDVDPPFADNRHEIEQEIVSLSSREHELQTELQQARDDLAINRARLGVLRQASGARSSGSEQQPASDPSREGRSSASEAPAASRPGPELTQEEKDHEIAVMLQRQMEREMAEEDRAQRQAAQPSGGGPAGNGGGGSHFTFSFSRSGGQEPGQGFTFSSSGDPAAQAQMEEMIARMRASRGDPFGGLGAFGFGSAMDRDLFGDGGFGRSHPLGAAPSEFMGPMDPFERRSSFGRIGFSPFMFGPVGPFGVGGLNVDLDSMDHDQILRLQEMIGHVPRGASAREISELPTSQYQAVPESDESKAETDANDERRKCSICLEQFEEGDQIRTLPCFHIFHADEIDKWLQQNSACPICRQPIQSRDEADVPPS